MLPLLYRMDTKMAMQRSLSRVCIQKIYSLSPDKLSKFIPEPLYRLCAWLSQHIQADREGRDIFSDWFPTEAAD